MNNKYIHTEEEAVLIATYTYEEEEEENTENSPYKILNKKLRNDNYEDQISSKKSYTRLLLQALRKFPRTTSQTLYRGVKDDDNQYSVGMELIWKGFSSTSTSLRTTQTFLAKEKTSSTLFEIRGMWGYNISDFSNYPKEQGKIFYDLFFLNNSYCSLY